MTDCSANRKGTAAPAPAPGDRARCLDGASPEARAAVEALVRLLARAAANDNAPVGAEPEEPRD